MKTRKELKPLYDLLIRLQQNLEDTCNQKGLFLLWELLDELINVIKPWKGDKDDQRTT